jgi:hypothetical protein
VAHVAFAHDAALGIVLRNSVRTIPRAVLASNAGFSVVDDNTGDGIFCVSFNGTARKARRLKTMITAHREMEPLRMGVPTAFYFTDTAPVNMRGIPVLLVARNHATLADDALRHVEVEAILFAESKSALRNSRRRRGGGYATMSVARGSAATMRHTIGSALFFRSL